MSIRLKDISLTLGNKKLFDHFNLDIPAGEHLVIKGPSGRGKSTLLNLMMGFVQPDEGKVRIDGEELMAKNVWHLRQQMVMVSQDQRLGQGTVREIVKEVLDYKANRHIAFEESKALRWFDAFSLEWEKWGQEISQLSGGENQRIALIIGLLLERPIMLLDEVTNAIDQSLRAKVIRTIASLNDKTIVAVAHEDDWQQNGFDTFKLNAP